MNWENRVVMQLPQPTRPINSYDFESTSTAPINVPMPLSQPTTDPPVMMMPQTQYQDAIPPQYLNHPHVYMPPATTVEGPEEEEEEEEEDRVALVKLLRSVKDVVYVKFPAKIQDQLNFETIMEPTTKQKGASARQLRGSLDDLSKKLERFKIRTLDPEIVVVNDDDQDQPKRR